MFLIAFLTCMVLTPKPILTLVLHLYLLPAHFMEHGSAQGSRALIDYSFSSNSIDSPQEENSPGNAKY